MECFRRIATVAGPEHNSGRWELTESRERSTTPDTHGRDVSSAAMRRDGIDVLFDYMYWANHRLLDSADRLANDRFVENTAVTTRDLRATLVHELDVEWSWRENLRGHIGVDDAELDPAHYPDVRSLSDHWQRDEAEMREWLGSLSDADLAEDVYSTFTDERRPMWVFLVHIVTHAAQQQADAATLLSLAGQSPGELTFLEYLSSR